MTKEVSCFPSFAPQAVVAIGANEQPAQLMPPRKQSGKPLLMLLQQSDLRYKLRSVVKELF
jgi:hypothetical protein